MTSRPFLSRLRAIFSKPIRTDGRVSALTLGRVVGRHIYETNEAAKFETLCRLWYTRNGEDPLLGFKIGAWIAKRTQDEMPYYPHPELDRLKAIFEGAIAQGRLHLTPAEVQQLAEANTVLTQRYSKSRDMWLQLLGILQSLCACRFDEALARHLDTIGEREVPLAKDEMLRLLMRPAA